MLQAAGLRVYTVFMTVASVVAGSSCDADSYYDAVMGKCVPCSDICYGEIKTEFCIVNCPGYSKRNTTQLSHEPVLSGTGKSTVVSLETMTSAVSLQSAQPFEAHGATKSQDNRSSDVLTISLAVVSVLLVVLLLTFSVAVVVVLSRSGKRCGRCDRRWPTQRSLLSDGDNDDSVSTATSTKRSGREDVSGPSTPGCDAFGQKPSFAPNILPDGRDHQNPVCYLMVGTAPPTVVCQLPLQKMPASSSA